MFNDRYGLTQAVLEGRKTMTRRVIADTKVIQSLLEIEEDGALNDADPDIRCIIDGKAKYKVGEVVAVAQSYMDVMHERNDHGVSYLVAKAGYTNKMFVRADLMPHKIRITRASIERLQDICREDCRSEGIQSVCTTAGWRYVPGGRRISAAEQNRILSERIKLSADCAFDSPQTAFAFLIDATSGKDTWDSNPFVFVYEFDLIC